MLDAAAMSATGPKTQVDFGGTNAFEEQIYAIGPQEPLQVPASS